MPDLHGDTITTAPVPVVCHRDDADDCAACLQGLASAASSNIASSLQRLRPDASSSIASFLQRLRSACSSLACCLLGSICNVASCLMGLGHVANYYFCLFSCLYLFLWDAFATLFFHICCCRCLTFLLKTPEFAPEPANPTQTFFFFCCKQLSNLWVSAMIFFIAWSVVCRPFDLPPMLGACTVYEFQLQSPAATAGSPATIDLRFNISTHILFKNSGSYSHLGVAMFYADDKLGPADDGLESFYLPMEVCTVMNLVVSGRLRNTSSSVVETFARERVQGRFEMLVRIHATLTYKFWPFNEVYFVMYECPLSSPVPKIDEPAMTSPVLCKIT